MVEWTQKSLTNLVRSIRSRAPKSAWVEFAQSIAKSISRRRRQRIGSIALAAFRQEGWIRVAEALAGRLNKCARLEVEAPSSLKDFKRKWANRAARICSNLKIRRMPNAD